ncbi:DUF1588 domain-containing protein [Rubinisphaera margarita]|uniref:DUF1588 domain-containing protein n=1 Tax=Rubinisphaera margarita TaxID=2909586 RepID=UPI001EE78D6A|nr:DUF1588 domain-containing protein [Rubinisphaera margarita]MCG6156357.1 DUF1588 domain-containing protein [Rubinisphaera margarita]
MRYLIALLLAGGLPAAPLRGEVPSNVTRFVENHCLDCHSGPESESGFNLDSLGFRLDDARLHREWAKALDRVRRGEMPPEDYDRPEADEIKLFVDVLRSLLVEAERKRYAAEGRATVRRLSRDEHINALRQLLHLPGLSAGEKLPPDGLSDGFGKSSFDLPFSHIQIDRYLEVADEAVRAAMASQRNQPATKKSQVWISEIRGETVKQSYGNANGQPTLILSKQSPFLYGSLKSGSGMPIRGRMVDDTFDSWPGDFSTRTPGYVLDEAPFIDAVGVLGHDTNAIGGDFKATQDGRYRIRVGAFSFQANHGRVETNDRTEVVAFYSDTRLLGHVDVTPQADVHEIEVWLNAGETVSVSAASLPLWRIEPKDKKTNLRYPVVNVPAVAFQGFEMEGPFVDLWPPASHRRLFGDLEMQPLEKRDDSGRDYEVISKAPEADANRLLTSFMADAYRREITPTDLTIPLQMFRHRLSEGASFQEAILSAYAAVLSSPHFVLVPMEPGPLPPHRLADRLALFLWNSPSDAELRNNVAAASAKEFHEIVDGMIDDSRAEQFVHHFTDHWLDLRNIGTTEPDENLYSGFSTWLMESMIKETRAFVLAMLRDNLPARSVFDSEIVFTNGALAELYEIEGVKGGEIQRVRLPSQSLRGGLVTQASLLKVSANGTTTSPVVRGVYVMDRLLGDPPPPPPEAVAAVEPDLSGATTIRELMAAHREDASCAACHRKIDPPGFALESFDVMGRYRERYHSLDKGELVAGLNRRAKPLQYKLGLPVDSAGELTGQPFANIEDFRRLVLKDERAIARNLLERLTVYATGAPIGVSDREEIEAILDQTAADGFGLRSMIHGLIQSPLFMSK